MLCGLFTNRDVRNLIDPTLSPGITTHLDSGDQLPLWQAALRYGRTGTPLVIVAGERYGSGSSRDWAAKGTSLLGVSAVLARSFERIHRTNLIGMGIVPIQLTDPGLSAEWRVDDQIVLDLPTEQIQPRQTLMVQVIRASGETVQIESRLAVETGSEVALLAADGVIPLMLERTLRG